MEKKWEKQLSFSTQICVSLLVQTERKAVKQSQHQLCYLRLCKCQLSENMNSKIIPNIQLYRREIALISYQQHQQQVVMKSRQVVLQLMQMLNVWSVELLKVTRHLPLQRLLTFNPFTGKLSSSKCSVFKNVTANTSRFLYLSWQSISVKAETWNLCMFHIRTASNKVVLFCDVFALTM